MPHQCTNCGRTFDDGSKEMLSGCPDCEGTTFQFSPDGFDDAPETPPDPPERPDDGMARTVGNAAATVRDLVTGSADPDATRATPPRDTTDADVDTDAVRKGETTAGPPTSSPSATDDPDDIIVAESAPSPGDTAPEDAAQTDARSQVADSEELPEPDGFDPVVDDEDGSTPTPADMAATTDPPADGVATTDDGGTDSAADGPDSAADGPDSAGAAESAPHPGDGRTVATEPDAETADRPDLAELREELNDQFESIRIVERGQYELNLMELYDRDEVIVALGEDGRYSIRVPEAIGEVST